MPRTTIPVATVDRLVPSTALPIVNVDMSNGMQFANEGGNVYLFIHNDGTDTLTVTIVTQVLVDGLPVNDAVFYINFEEYHIIGPFPGNIYNTVDKKVQVNISHMMSDSDISIVGVIA